MNAQKCGATGVQTIARTDALTRSIKFSGTLPRKISDYKAPPHPSPEGRGLNPLERTIH